MTLVLSNADHDLREAIAEARRTTSSGGTYRAYLAFFADLVEELIASRDAMEDAAYRGDEHNGSLTRYERARARVDAALSGARGERRIEIALAQSGSAAEPPADYQQRVFAAIQSKPSWWRRLWGERS